MHTPNYYIVCMLYKGILADKDLMTVSWVISTTVRAWMLEDPKLESKVSHSLWFEKKKKKEKEEKQKKGKKP